MSLLDTAGWRGGTRTALVNEWELAPAAVWVCGRGVHCTPLLAPSSRTPVAMQGEDHALSHLQAPSGFPRGCKQQLWTAAHVYSCYWGQGWRVALPVLHISGTACLTACLPSPPLPNTVACICADRAAAQHAREPGVHRGGHVSEGLGAAERGRQQGSRGNGSSSGGRQQGRAVWRWHTLQGEAASAGEKV